MTFLLNKPKVFDGPLDEDFYGTDQFLGEHLFILLGESV